MTYILNKDLKNNKRVITELGRVFGINICTARIICAKGGMTKQITIGELTEERQRYIEKYVYKYLKIGTELQTKMYQDKKKKMDIKSYQGLRHLCGLPVNGQRTRSNGRTAKMLLGSKEKINKW